MKYSWEFKLECVNKYKKGEYINISGSPGFHHTFMNYVRDWVAAYDELGVDGLKHSPTNKKWTPEERFELVTKVLAGHSIASVARNTHINPSHVYQLVRRYNEKGMVGLQCKKGRPTKQIVVSLPSKHLRTCPWFTMYPLIS